MYLCVRGVDYACFYGFDKWLWKCSVKHHTLSLNIGWFNKTAHLTLNNNLLISQWHLFYASALTWCIKVKVSSLRQRWPKPMLGATREAVTAYRSGASPAFSEVRVAWYLIFCVVFCGLLLVLLFFCPVYFGHCVVCPSSIYSFWLPFWYLKFFLVFLFRHIGFPV